MFANVAPSYSPPWVPSTDTPISVPLFKDVPVISDLETSAAAITDSDNGCMLSSCVSGPEAGSWSEHDAARQIAASIIENVLSRFVEGTYNDYALSKLISKELIEYGFEKARELGFKAVIVEGNPMNYRSRGFVTSADFGITAHESVGLPAPECLMVRELTPGGLEGIHGVVSYHDYECLR